MYVITVFIILLAAIPGVLGVRELVKGPPELRNRRGAWYLGVLTFLSTAVLLVSNHFDYLF